MRSTSMTTPMLTLPHDALSEVALRLPAVNSAKPWRDLNSLATTCMRLYQWKTKVDNYVETEWKRVCAEVAKTKGWRDSLEKILSDFEHPSIRLFREPILRKITKAEKKTTAAKPITSVSDFNVSLYKKRETASLNEISWCLIVCSHKKLEINKKIELVAKLPSFLTELKSNHRQKALRMMFILLDNDEELGLSLKKNGILKKIEESLGDDQQSKILFELGLYSRELSKITLNFLMVRQELSNFPKDKRWLWLLKNVPEFLGTDIGLLAMLRDPACRTQMIDHLDELFSKCPTEGHRLAFCAKVSKVYSKLYDCKEGKRLVKKLVHWFLEAPDFIAAQDSLLESRYVDLLSKHIALVKIYFGKKEKKLLSVKMVKEIKYSSRIKAYDQSTSILMALAKEDIELFKEVVITKSSIGRKEVLIDILNNVALEKDIKDRQNVIAILCEAAEHHFCSDQAFISEFIRMAYPRLEPLSKSFKNAIEDVGSTTSES